ncbi:MAG: 4Fe-4S binding protein [bacterium]
MTDQRSRYRGLAPLPPPFVKEHPPIAAAVESLCIGCDRCPPLCFFDALVMEHRAQHLFKRVAVVIPDYCTGCGLCFEACPVDAIIWVPDKNVSPQRAEGHHTEDIDV